MSDPESPLNPPASSAAKLKIPEGTFALTYDKLDSEAIIQSVQDDTAGAIAVFIGTTRNSFQGASNDSSVFLVYSWRLFWVSGQVVTRLEYQAYSTTSAGWWRTCFCSFA